MRKDLFKAGGQPEIGDREKIREMKRREKEEIKAKIRMGMGTGLANANQVLKKP